MDIKKLIQVAHANAIKKGSCDCPKCGGKVLLRGITTSGEHVAEDCDHCNETGIDPDKNIGEMLMLIVSELGEALEAHRKGRFIPVQKDYSIEEITADLLAYGKRVQSAAIEQFEENIKDTFEDEIADVFIRLLDLCGYLEIVPDEVIHSYLSRPKIARNVGESLLKITYEISEMYFGCSGREGWIDPENYGYIFAYLREFCLFHNIQIEKHIEAKMAYNRTRPRKHGKIY